MDAVVRGSVVADGGPAGNGRFDYLQKMKNRQAESDFTVLAYRAGLKASEAIYDLRGAARINGRRVIRGRACVGAMGRGQEKCGWPHHHEKVSA